MARRGAPTRTHTLGGLSYTVAVVLVLCLFVRGSEQRAHLRVLNASPPWYGSLTNTMDVRINGDSAFNDIVAGGITGYRAVSAGSYHLQVRQSQTNALVADVPADFVDGRSYTFWLVVRTDGEGGTAYEAGLNSENDQSLAYDAARVTFQHLGCTIAVELGGCGDQTQFFTMALAGPSPQTLSFAATNDRKTTVLQVGDYSGTATRSANSAALGATETFTLEGKQFWSVYMFDHLSANGETDACILVVPDFDSGTYSVPGACRQIGDGGATPDDVYFVNGNDSLTNCAAGCANGNAVPIGDHINIVGCPGVFTGYVGGASAQALCAPAWHVCSQTLPADLMTLKNVSYTEASSFNPGCFNYDAADDFDTCRPCTGNIHEDDIAGMGSACTNKMPMGNHGISALRDPSCINQGRVDNCCQGYRQSNGCQYQPGVTSGVMCCADNAESPCFNGQCPRQCCGNGLCNKQDGNCECLPGFSGDDCCTQCTKLDCEDCLKNDFCAFCANTQSCVQNGSSTCFEFARNCPVIYEDEGSTDEVNGVPIGAIIGAALGGLLLTLCLCGILLGVLLYFKFGRGEYATMWNDVLFSGVGSSPLYEASGPAVSGLYDGH